MTRKVIMAFLLATCILTLAACRGNQYVNLETLKLIDIKRDTKALEDTRKALADLGIDVNDPQIPFAAMPPEEDDSVSAPKKRNYIAAPSDIFRDWAEHKGLTGNYYYIPGGVEEFGAFDDGTEYMVLTVEFGYIAVKKTGSQGGWDRIKAGDSITVYFQYVSFLE